MTKQISSRLTSEPAREQERASVRRASAERPFFMKRASQPFFGGAHAATARELDRYLRPKHTDLGVSLCGATLFLENRLENRCDVRENQTLFLPDDVLRRNVMVLGKIGSGKTQRVMFPMIASALERQEASALILGSKGDEYDVVSAICRAKCPTRRVECLNLSDPRRSTVGWNPLARPDAKNRKGAAMENANILLKAEGVYHSDPFFRNGAAMLIAGVILWLEDKIGWYARPVDVFEILNSTSKVFELLKKAKSENRPFLSELFNYLENGNHNLQTTIVEAQGHIKAFIDDDLATVTACDDFQIESLFNEPTALVMEATQDVCQNVRPVTNMFMSQLFDAVARTAKRMPGAKLPRPLFVFLDDFAAAVGYIPDCANRFNMMRSMDVRFTLALQSRAQLEMFYSRAEAEAITAACGATVYVPPVAIEDAEAASRESGTATFAARPIERDKSGARRAIGFGARSAADSEPREAESRGYADEGAFARALYVADEVNHSPRHEDYGRAVTVFLPDERPFQTWLPYAYQRPDLASYLQASGSDGANVRQGAELQAARCNCNWVKEMRSYGFRAINDELPNGRQAERIDKLEREVCAGLIGAAKRCYYKIKRRESPDTVEKFLLALKKRNASFMTFYHARLKADVRGLEGVLHFMDYLHCRERESYELF